MAQQNARDERARDDEDVDANSTRRFDLREQSDIVAVKPRITWMDTLRGSAILLLLLWHASSVPRQFGFAMPSWLFLLNEVFLPWRMPTLMLLSGLLLSASLRKPPAEYFVGKVRNILWPYMVWAAMFLGFYPEPGESITNPVSWFGAGYLWFLCYLFLYYMSAPVITRLPGWVVLPTLMCGALFVPWTSPQKVLFFAVFYFAGHYLTSVLTWATTAPARWLWGGLAISVVFTVASLALSAQRQTHYFQFAALAIPFVLVQILTSARLAHDADRRWAGTLPLIFMSWVGRNSIAFYLSHVPAMLAACALVSLGVSQPTLWIVAVCYLAALTVGCLLARFNAVIPMTWLFRAPSRSHRTRTVA